MIITGDMRAAIRSAEKKQPNRHGINWERRYAQEKAATNALAQSPKWARKFQNAVAIKAEADALYAKFAAITKAMGITSALDRISDTDAFVAAGGVPPAEDKSPWRFDTVMAELAACDPKQGKAILKKYGINWA